MDSAELQAFGHAIPDDSSIRGGEQNKGGVNHGGSATSDGLAGPSGEDEASENPKTHGRAPAEEATSLPGDGRRRRVVFFFFFFFFFSRLIHHSVSTPLATEKQTDRQGPPATTEVIAAAPAMMKVVRSLPSFSPAHFCVPLEHNLSG